MTTSDPARRSAKAALRQLFKPILAGATLTERLIGCLGALVATALTGFLCGLLLGPDPHLPLIVAPIGASAVLLFVVPASPLAQPWSIIGGNSLSALSGLVVAHFIHEPALAIGLAVSLAIAAMSLTRCLHPPGGAVAMMTVLGGQAIADWGLLFPIVPVGLNSAILVTLGIVAHKLSRRAYPHLAPPDAANLHQTRDLPPQLRAGFSEADIEAALMAMHETFDIDRGDLKQLLMQVELQATIRRHGPLSCADIMSRDVIRVSQNDTPETARALLLRHNIRTLPVTDAEGRLLGTVGLRELIGADGAIGANISRAATALPHDPALALLPLLTDGKAHAVVIVDEDERIEGLISQTDLLSAVSRALALGEGQDLKPALNRPMLAVG
ncbi:MAG: HPP family protein [Rhizobium sp.]|nr:HPP family protein [Rhizobium sp.]